MSASDDLRQPRPGEICIDAAQLRPGLYVRLPIPWMEHQFMFGAFVIADDEQVRQIKAMNLPQLYCDPDVAACRLSPNHCRQRHLIRWARPRSCAWPKSRRRRWLKKWNVPR